jgi:Bifunctional DNA primase/polymerase, N-terminal
VNLLADAVRAIQRGWWVFPVQPFEKTPHLIRPDKPWTLKWGERSTNDLATVIKYWTWSPEANVGIACKPSNLFVVDCDMPKREYQLAGTRFSSLHDTRGPMVDGTGVFEYLATECGADWTEVRNTYSVCTGSMGVHYYYRWPEGVLSSQASILKGLCDVRGNGGTDGGYVLGAGSCTSKGPYIVENDLPVADAPEWLIRYCTDGARDVVPAGLSQYVRPATGGHIGGLEESVLTAPDGNRNNILVWAARAACNDGIPEDEAIAVLGNAYVLNGGDGGQRQAEQTVRSGYRLQRAKM